MTQNETNYFKAKTTEDGDGEHKPTQPSELQNFKASKFFWSILTKLRENSEVLYNMVKTPTTLKALGPRGLQPTSTGYKSGPFYAEARRPSDDAKATKAWQTSQ